MKPNKLVAQKSAMADNQSMMILKYKVREHGDINAQVGSIEAARSFLLDHEEGKIQPFIEGFGSSALLSIPTLTDVNGKVVARFAYNGRLLNKDGSVQ